VTAPTSTEPKDSPRVHIERHPHGVVLVTLDDARRKNVMTPELGDALHASLASLEADARDGTVRAVVITGAGGAFSSGGDLAMLDRLRSLPFTESHAFMLHFYRRFLAVLDVPVPTIAAVRGPAIGAGLAFALACDLVVFAEDAKLASNFVALGLHPGMGTTYLLPARCGAERARELIFTGRRFDGKEAVAMGLGLEAVADAEVVPRAIALATAMAKNGPLAVRATKQTLGLDRAALDRALAREAFAQAESYTSAELGEGLAAAKERRSPSWASG
jgi:enoyl-CoA hydratase/carnithine racemase